MDQRFPTRAIVIRNHLSSVALSISREGTNKAAPPEQRGKNSETPSMEGRPNVPAGPGDPGLTDRFAAKGRDRGRIAVKLDQCNGDSLGTTAYPHESPSIYEGGRQGCHHLYQCHLCHNHLNRHTPLVGSVSLSVFAIYLYKDGGLLVA